MTNLDEFFEKYKLDPLKYTFIEYKIRYSNDNYKKLRDFMDKQNPYKDNIIIKKVFVCLIDSEITITEMRKAENLWHAT